VKLRERYLTPENIDKKTARFLNESAPLSRHTIDSFQLSEAALIIIDMQKFFVNTESRGCIPTARVILPRLLMLAEKFIDSRRPVFFTRHLNTSQNAGNMLHWWKDIITQEDPLSGLVSELERLPGRVISKTRYDAFYKTSLHDLLQHQGVTRLVISGVITHLCCETTIRSSFMRGYKTYFPVDGTADYNEKFHRASLMNLAHGFAVPVTVSQIVEKMDQKK